MSIPGKDPVLGPAAVLRTLQVGESVLFARYTLTSQVASTIQRLRKLDGLHFATRAEAGGVRVTRISNVSDLLGDT